MIHVFGSLNVDFFMQVKSFPGSGETVTGGNYYLAPGGKGANQAAAAARLGANVAMHGMVGDDQWAETVLAALAEDGVDISAVGKTSDAGTAIASILINADGENLIAVASGANMLASADSLNSVSLTINDYLVLQMEVEAEANWQALNIAHKAGATTVLNVAPAAIVPENVLSQVDFLVVNESEARLVAHAMASLSLEDMAQALSKAYNLTTIITLGPDGAIATQGEEMIRVPSLEITPVDTTGAGDAFIGTLVTMLSEGGSLKEAMEYACKSAALSCSKPGAMPSYVKRNTLMELDNQRGN